MTLAKSLIALVGLADTLAASALLLAPEWFFTAVGQERHILKEPRYGRQTWQQFLAEHYPPQAA